MLSRRFKIKPILIALASLSISNHALAAAYSIFGEASGKNSGDYAAGVGAEAYDASSLYYNPAGLIHLNGSRVDVSGTLIHVNSKFSGSNGIDDFSNISTNLNVVNQAKNTVIPSIFYSKKVNDRLAWGVGIFAPFGLATDWGENTDLKFSATKTQLQIIELSPGVSIQLTDNLSAGAALDMQYGTVDYNAVLGVPGDSYPVKVHGSSTGLGGHAGLMWQVNPSTRLGINYQSQVRHQFKGDSVAASPGDDNYNTSDNTHTDAVNFPAMVTFGAFHQVNTQLGLMATVTYTEWSSIQSLTLRDIAISGTTTSLTALQHSRNTWKIAGGLKYQLNPKWLLRGGIGWDQTPTNNIDRDIRLPDGNRIGLAIGGHYQYNKRIGIDMGWTHLFMQKANINKVQILDPGIDVDTDGVVKGCADLFGAQVSWKID